ncbi:MAG: hypothetical protein JNL02_12365 [Saprospiraceae bacterium]|nr:hypothetical protein [Saprospiraceae bacterium]
MAEQKDFNSLDELFRNTFDQLPESPDPDGWDTPSERVWQHVQTRIKPPRQGWSSAQIMLVAAGAIAIMVGLYLALVQPQPAQVEDPSSEIANEQTYQAPVAQPEVAVESPVQTLPAQQPIPKRTPPAASAETQMPPTSAKPAISAPLAAPVADKPAATADQPKTQPKVNSTGKRAERTGALPLPGSDPSDPNSTVLRNRYKRWKTPLTPLSLTLKPDAAPALPDAVKTKD